jgi:hypothetical protein
MPASLARTVSHVPVLLGALAVLAVRPLAAQSLAEVDVAVRQGIRGGAYPGAVVVIGRRDSILYA